MKPSRKVQLWLADRHPAFDRPSLYRRPAPGAVMAEPVASGWDALLIGTASLVLIAIGVCGLLFGLFLAGVIVSTWLG
jgi:hypothetical protein